MCRECGTWPHLPGCPEAPEGKPDYICDWCGEEIVGGPGCEADYYEINFGMVCPACIEKVHRWL